MCERDTYLIVPRAILARIHANPRIFHRSLQLRGRDGQQSVSTCTRKICSSRKPLIAPKVKHICPFLIASTVLRMCQHIVPQAKLDETTYSSAQLRWDENYPSVSPSLQPGPLLVPASLCFSSLRSNTQNTVVPRPRIDYFGNHTFLWLYFLMIIIPNLGVNSL